MIATLNGMVTEKLLDYIVLEVNGLGYGLLVPLEDYAKLVIGDQARLYVYEHLRETTHDLYGFTKVDTKHLFEQLLAVNGVGPKMALSILGVGSVESVRRAIASGDIKFIQVASGVGKRLAERVVVELKDKVGLITGAGADSFLVGNTVAEQDEAVQALAALGYTVPDAVSALEGIDTALVTEERVRQALKESRL